MRLHAICGPSEVVLEVSSYYPTMGTSSKRRSKRITIKMVLNLQWRKSERTQKRKAIKSSDRSRLIVCRSTLKWDPIWGGPQTKGMVRGGKKPVTPTTSSLHERKRHSRQKMVLAHTKRRHINHETYTVL